MKGIKECINWLVDNPMKEIENPGYYKTRYNDSVGKFEHLDDDCGREWVTTKYFDKFRECEWKQVRKTYSFEEAYKICKDEKVAFENEDGEHCMYFAGDKDWNQINIDHKEDANGTGCVILCGNWYKV